MAAVFSGSAWCRLLGVGGISPSLASGVSKKYPEMVFELGLEGQTRICLSNEEKEFLAEGTVLAKIRTQEASQWVGTEGRCRKKRSWSMVRKWTGTLPVTSQWTPGRAWSLRVQAGEIRNYRRMGEGGPVTVRSPSDSRGWQCEERGGAGFENL